MNLWEGLRRVYFGVIEFSPTRGPLSNRCPDFQASTSVLFAHDSPRGAPVVIPHEPVEDREIAALRREIAELEERARRYRQTEGGLSSLLSFRDDDEDDESSSSPVLPLVLVVVTGSRVTSVTSATTPAASSRTSKSSSSDRRNRFRRLAAGVVFRLVPPGGTWRLSAGAELLLPCRRCTQSRLP